MTPATIWYLIVLTVGQSGQYAAIGTPMEFKSEQSCEQALSKTQAAASKLPIYIRFVCVEK